MPIANPPYLYGLYRVFFLKLVAYECRVARNLNQRHNLTLLITSQCNKGGKIFPFMVIFGICRYCKAAKWSE